MSQTDAYTDVVELCALLQCLGFSVKSLDSSDANASQAEAGTRTVVINCQSSGLHVVLETPSANCSCPANTQQNSGVWQVSGVTGGKQLDKEFGCNLLGSLPKSHRDRLSKELHEIIRCIRQNNETDPDKMNNNKSASMTEMHTPEKNNFKLKPDTPTRYRSLDTLTAKQREPDLPAPGPLQRPHLVSESSGDDVKDPKIERIMCNRQGTYTLPTPSPSGSGSIRRWNKTSSPIHAPQNSVLERLVAAEKAAEELRQKLGLAIGEYMDQFKDDSSISSLALDVSKISVLKGADCPRAQFASSPNLSAIKTTDDFIKSRLMRFESSSTSNLASKPTESKMSRFRRISPNIFKKTETPVIKIEKAKNQDGKSKFHSLFKPRIVTPIRTFKPSQLAAPNSSPNLSSSSRKKFSHVKSTIPRPAKKE